jgi:hypothetical protein
MRIGHALAVGALCAGMLRAFSLHAAEPPLPGSSATDQVAPAMPPSLAQACPHTVISLPAAAARQRQPPIASVTRPALQHELVLMAEADQHARAQWNPSNPMPEDVRQVDQHNLLRIRQILHQEGVPTAAMVGYNGMQAFWLLLQHVPDESGLRARWLPVVLARAKTGDLSVNDAALMIDRTLVSSGKPQRYGSQAYFQDGAMIVRPSEAPRQLEQRRAALGLIPESDYLCILQFYAPGPQNLGSSQ